MTTIKCSQCGTEMPDDQYARAYGRCARHADEEREPTQEHSPLPWHNGNHPLVIECEIDDRDILVAEINRTDEQIRSGNESAEANARFICLAANNHDSLVNMLRAVIIDLISMNYVAQETFDEARALLERIGK